MENAMNVGVVLSLLSLITTLSQGDEASSNIHKNDAQMGRDASSAGAEYLGTVDMT